MRPSKGSRESEPASGAPDGPAEGGRAPPAPPAGSAAGTSEDAAAAISSAAVTTGNIAGAMFPVEFGAPASFQAAQTRSGRPEASRRPFSSSARLAHRNRLSEFGLPAATRARRAADPAAGAPGTLQAPKSSKIGAPGASQAALAGVGPPGKPQAAHFADSEAPGTSQAPRPKVEAPAISQAPRVCRSHRSPVRACGRILHLRLLSIAAL